MRCTVFADTVGLLILSGIAAFAVPVFGYLWYTRNDPYFLDEDDLL